MCVCVCITCPYSTPPFPQLLPEVVQMSRAHIAEGELHLSRGELVYVIDKPAGGGSWLGIASDGTIGYFSSEFARSVDPREMQ